MYRVVFFLWSCTFLYVFVFFVCICNFCMYLYFFVCICALLYGVSVFCFFVYPKEAILSTDTSLLQFFCAIPRWAPRSHVVKF